MLLVVLRPVERLLRPVDVEVDSELIELLVVLRPVDRLSTPVDRLLMPVDAEVDSELTELLVVLRPVERLSIPARAQRASGARARLLLRRQ